MQLTAWPVTSADEMDFDLDFEEPDLLTYLCRTLDKVGQQTMRGVHNTHLAPEILDPWVFFQCVTGIQGHHSFDGTPFAGNWRNTICARRMAERLGAEELAKELRAAEAALDHYGPELMSSYDRGAYGELFQDQPEKLRQEMNERFDWCLEAPVSEGLCTYGILKDDHEPAEKLLAALAEWVEADMPREVLYRDEVRERLRLNHEWACENVDGFERSFVSFYVGRVVYEMLHPLGLRFARSQEVYRTKQIRVSLLSMNDDRKILRWHFREGEMLVDPETMLELARHRYPESMIDSEHRRKMLNWSDRPILQIDLNSKKVHVGMAADPALKILKYNA